MARSKINATISARILAYMVNGGMSLQQAFDTVLGPAQYECLALELYEELGARMTEVVRCKTYLQWRKCAVLYGTLVGTCRDNVGFTLDDDKCMNWAPRHKAAKVGDHVWGM